MIPSFKPGDRVVCFRWSKINAGDVVVFEDHEKVYIKRVVEVSGELFYIEGDNKTDSAKMGPVKKEQVVGKVIYRY